MALTKQSDTILNSTLGPGNAIAYPGVRVQAFFDEIEQPLYSDGAGTPIERVETDQNGFYQFWIEEGDYVLRFSVGGTVLGSDDYSIFKTATASDLNALQNEVDQMVIAPTYTDASVSSLSPGQAAGTSSVIAANPARRNVKMVPPADCVVRIASGGVGGIPIFAGVANDIPLANALFVTGLAAGAALTILEA